MAFSNIQVIGTGLGVAVVMLGGLLLAGNLGSDGCTSSPFPPVEGQPPIRCPQRSLVEDWAIPALLIGLMATSGALSAMGFWKSQRFFAVYGAGGAAMGGVCLLYAASNGWPLFAIGLAQLALALRVPKAPALAAAAA